MSTESNVMTEPRRDASPARSPLELRHHVAQLTGLLEELTDEQYCTEPVGGFPCSIGQQVRHLLDHVDALVRGIESGIIDYDARERGTPVETERAVAIDEVERLGAALDRNVPFAKAVDLMLMLDSAEGALRFRSTLGREIAFVLSHTVHHQAMIAAMASSLDVPVPKYFGYAPATIAHLEQQEENHRGTEAQR